MPKSSASPNPVICRARLRPGLFAQHPSIDPEEWYPVIRSNPTAVDPVPRAGNVWVQIRGRARQLPASILLFDRRRVARPVGPRDFRLDPATRNDDR